VKLREMRWPDDVGRVIITGAPAWGLSSNMHNNHGKVTKLSIRQAARTLKNTRILYTLRWLRSTSVTWKSKSEVNRPLVPNGEAGI